MSLLERFEKMAELLIAGVFKKGGLRLQPVEIAKELARVMLKNKQISVSQVYVPNVYRVYLNPGDWEPLAGFGEVYLIELSKYLFAEGERQGYLFLTKPAIELHADDTVKPKDIIIETEFDDLISVDWQDEETDEETNEEIGWETYGESGEEGDWLDGTAVFQEQDMRNIGEKVFSGRDLAYYIEVIEGPDSGKVFLLSDREIIIGRHKHCEWIIDDPEVSRRHLKIIQGKNDWLLEDLGSTNGSYVNGRRIIRQKVGAGDMIQIGQSILVICRDFLEGE